MSSAELDVQDQPLARGHGVLQIGFEIDSPKPAGRERLETQYILDGQRSIADVVLA